MNFLKIKHITIKSLVTLANFLATIALLLVFLTFIEKISVNLSTMLKVAYILLTFAIVTFIFYHVARGLQIKKSSFQLLKRHKVYNYSFYYVEYLCFLLNLMIIILINTKLLVNNNVTIVFWVFFPFFIIATMIASVLESIIRVEERIFINQQQLKHAEANKADSDNLQTVEADINPFLTIVEEIDTKNEEDEDNKK